MKKTIYVIVVAILASACSSPKYTASFNSYDVNTGYQASKKAEVVEQSVVVEPEQLLASTSAAPVEFNEVKKEEVRKTYVQMSKTERKELRNQLRSEFKNYVKEVKKNSSVESVKATNAMDHDLKMALIFGIIGVVLGGLFTVNNIIGFIGFVAIVIALVFLIKWLVRQ